MKEEALCSEHNESASPDLKGKILMGTPWLGMPQFTEMFGIYTQNSKETPTEGTGDPTEVVSLWESFQSGENIHCGGKMLKNPPSSSKY